MARKLTITRDNTIASRRPDLLEEWDWERNAELGLDPYVLACGSNKKAWWLCPEHGHSNYAVIASRNKGYKCPYCSNKMVLPGYNDVATTHGHLLDEWDWERNTKTPTQITKGSCYKAAWICKACGHRYTMTFPDRRRGRKCPACSRENKINPKEIVTPGNSLKDVFPHVASEWHPTKNGDKLPEDYRPHSNKRVWWQCSFGHEWEAPINNRTGKGKRGCPKCKAHLHTSFPEMAVYYYVSMVFDDAVSNAVIERNGEAVSLDVWIPSLNTAIEYDGEYWHTSAEREERKNRFCLDNGIRLIRISEPGCVKYNDVISVIRIERDDQCSPESLDRAIVAALDVLECADAVSVDSDSDESEIRSIIADARITNSFGENYPEAAAEWHPTKNGTLTPYMVSHHSSFKAWFICKAGHEYKTAIAGRARGSGCNICAMKQCGREKMVPEKGESLADKYPLAAKAWHPSRNSDMTPWDVKPKSNKKYWWVCVKCGAEHQAEVQKKTRAPATFLCRQCALEEGGRKRRERAGRTLLAEIRRSNPDVEVIGPYVSYKTTMRCRCKACGNTWDAWPDNLHRGHGCPRCAIDKRAATRRKNTLERR